jgi:hypothetical protein
MPGSGLATVLEWRRHELSGASGEIRGPLEVATALANHSAAAFKLLPGLQASQKGDKELRLTLGDISALAHLGNYYAEKIRGAADLALFDKSGDAATRESAIRHLRLALDHWKRYATAYTLQYEQPRLYNRIGWVDIPALTAKVEQDISIARLWAPGTIPDKAPPRQADVPFRK